MAFEHHKMLPRGLKGVQPTRTVGDMLDSGTQRYAGGHDGLQSHHR